MWRLLGLLWRNFWQCRRPGFNPWVSKVPWRRKWKPSPIFLPGEVHRQRSLSGYSPQGHKELDMTEWLIHTHKRWENWGLERNGFVLSPKVNTCLFKFYNLGFWQGPIFSVNIFLVQKPNFYAHWVCLWQDTHALWCWSNGLLRVCSCAAHIYTTALKTHGVCACHSVLTSLKALSTDYAVSASIDMAGSSPWQAWAGACVRACGHAICVYQTEASTYAQQSSCSCYLIADFSHPFLQERDGPDFAHNSTWLCSQSHSRETWAG